MNVWNYDNRFFFFFIDNVIVFCILDGDIDGIYKGKRYMYIFFDLGKFFKFIDLILVLDLKVNKFCE